MRIIYYSPHPALFLDSHAGYGVHMREMIGAMEALGHEVLPVIIGGREGQAKFSGEGRQPGQMRWYSRMLPGILRETMRDRRLLQTDVSTAETLAKAVKSFRPDVIYERAAYMQTSGVDVARQMGIKHILEVNSPYVEERQEMQGKSLLQGRARNAEFRQLDQTNRIITVSSALRDYFIKYHGINAEKFLVIPNAVNPDYAETSIPDAEKLKKQYNLSGKKVIGFAGSLQRWHGLEMMLDAFEKVHNEFKESILLVIGDEGRRKAFLEMAEARGLTDSVIAPGSFTHGKVFPWLHLMDVGLVPGARWYMSPIKLFEYAVCNAYVVAVDTPPVREVLQDSLEGAVVAQNSDAFAQAIMAALRNQDEMREKAGRFRARVMHSFTWETAARRALDGSF